MKNGFENEDELEDEIDNEELEIAIFKYSITSYGADYPVDSLVKRLRDGSIFIPSFQRGYIWNLSDASGFIESLLLGLPVPGIFLGKEDDTQKLLVIDGQQRLKSLEFFYNGIFQPLQKTFALQGVQKRFQGLTYKTLEDEDRLRLDDSIIHATVVRQDVPSDDDSSIYYIFERLNTRGRRLHPQEIRASIFHGAFNDLLDELNTNQLWRQIYGKPSPRLKDQELILRFFALYYDWKTYERPMKEFLNQFMGANKRLKKYSKETLEALFSSTIALAHECLGDKAFKPEKALNAAVFDAVMVGLAKRLCKGAIKDTGPVKKNYEALLKNAEFKDAYERSTSNEEKISQRIELAINFFSDIK